MGADGGAVLEGRDTGTVVFPDAEVKVFLSATAEERARRRHQELLAKGQSITLAEVEKAIRERDRQDTERAAAPLRKAEDANELDSTPLGIPEVVAAIIKMVDARVSGRPRHSRHSAANPIVRGPFYPCPGRVRPFRLMYVSTRKDGDCADREFGHQQ